MKGGWVLAPYDLFCYVNCDVLRFLCFLVSYGNAEIKNV